MRAIVIDPFKKEVKEVNLNKDNLLQDLYNTIGCTTVESVGLKGGVDVIVDEEGLFKSSPAFMLGPIVTLHGRAVIVNVNEEEGEWIATNISLDLIKELTTFIDTEEADHLKRETLSGQTVKFMNF